MTGFWQGKRVFVTGHTGFKGSWMTLWLLSLGAEVAGLSLPPNTKPALFDQLGLASELQHHLEDIRQRDRVQQIISQFQPDVVFHLAAQPLVRRSYVEPVETWETNVLGTIHVLEALKSLDQPCAAVLITTDKCYENREWAYVYRVGIGSGQISMGTAIGLFQSLVGFCLLMLGNSLSRRYLRRSIW